MSKHWWTNKDHGAIPPDPLPDPDRDLSPTEEMLWRIAARLEMISATRLADARKIASRGKRSRAKRERLREQTSASLAGMDLARAIREIIIP